MRGSTLEYRLELNAISQRATAGGRRAFIKNVFRIFLRDVGRLFKAPAALVVAAALVVLPSLYTWFNVVGFWNPYENTGNLRVCVVNEDDGASSDLTGSMNIGNQIVEELQGNTQLGWVLTDYDTAMDELNSGKCYAVFVVPDDFSSNLLSILTSDFQEPNLEYYVNEKTGPVGPKITDSGSTTLDETVNSTFVSTVSSIVAREFDEKLDEAQTDLDEANAKVSTKLSEAQDTLADTRTSIEDLSTAASEAADKTTSAQAALSDVKADTDTLSRQLQNISQLTESAQNSVSTFVLSITPVMDESSLLLTQASSQGSTSIAAAAGAVLTAQGHVDAAIQRVQGVVDENAAIIAHLQTLQSLLPDGTAATSLANTLSELQARNDEAQTILNHLSQTSTDTGNAATSVSNAAAALSDATQGALTSTDAFRSQLTGSTLPTINSGLTQLASTASALSTALSNQNLLIDQTSGVLDQLSSTLQTSTQALDQTDLLIADMQSDLSNVQTDLTALGTSGAIANLLENSNIDAENIADFMSSPTELTTEVLYPLNAYGSAMAPLFMNLSLWIGAFMLMVILKLEVDNEGVEGLTLTQGYLGRWLFLAVLTVLQAAVCCTGSLVIGVQTVSAPLFYLTTILTALTYLSIMYALSTTLLHVGKGLCVILVFIQIGGATGLYPIEMTDEFFRTVYPMFPFTYGINALRETIAGFYDGQWLQLMGTLGLFAAGSFVLGIVVRPYMTNLNRMVSDQIKESDILNGEEVQTPARRYRITQLARALTDRGAYRMFLRTRTEKLAKLYPRLKWGALIAGIGVPVVLTMVLTLTNTEKVIMLTAWLVWLIVLIVFLLVIEHLASNLKRQVALLGMSDSEVRELMAERGRGRGRKGARVDASAGKSGKKPGSSKKAGGDTEPVQAAASDDGGTPDSDSNDDADKGDNSGAGTGKADEGEAGEAEGANGPDDASDKAAGQPDPSSDEGAK